MMANKKSRKYTPKALLIQTQKDIAVIAESNRNTERLLDNVAKIVDGMRAVVEGLVTRVEGVENTQRACKINEIVQIYDKLKVIIDGIHWLFFTKGGWIVLVIALVIVGAVPDVVNQLINSLIKKLIGG